MQGKTDAKFPLDSGLWDKPSMTATVLRDKIIRPASMTGRNWISQTPSVDGPRHVYLQTIK